MKIKRGNTGFLISLALLICVGLAGLTGYLQVKLDLHRFVFHKYLAYSALVLTLLHLVINWKQIRAAGQRLVKGS